VPRQELWPIVIVVIVTFPQEFLGVAVGVGVGLAVVCESTLQKGTPAPR